MSKIYVEKSSLDLNIVSNIESAITYLNSSIYDVGVLKIPYKFKYASYLKNLVLLNNDSKNDLINIKNKIDSDIEEYKKTASNNATNISNIVNTKI